MYLFIHLFTNLLAYLFIHSLFVYAYFRSQDTVVSMVTRPRGRRSWVRISARKKLFLYTKTSTLALGLPLSIREGDHTSHFIPRLRISGAIPLLPLHSFSACTGTVLRVFVVLSRALLVAQCMLRQMLRCQLTNLTRMRSWRHRTESSASLILPDSIIPATHLYHCRLRRRTSVPGNLVDLTFGLTGTECVKPKLVALPVWLDFLP